MSAERFRASARIDALYVPFPGGPEAMSEVMAGRLDYSLLPVGLVLPHLRDGKLRALAVNSTTRSAALPDLPTVAESGFPGFEATSWNAMLAPAGTPPEAVSRINAIVNAYLAGEKGKAELAKFDMQASGGTPEDLKSFMASEVAKWGPIIKAVNITME